VYIRIVYTLEMALTKVFRSGNSQAVRIPRQYRLDTDEVEIVRRGDELVLRKPAKSLSQAFDLLAGLSADFLKRGRKQPKPQRRPAL
jgi:antitoxin VapB